MPHKFNMRIHVFIDNRFGFYPKSDTFKLTYQWHMGIVMRNRKLTQWEIRRNTRFLKNQEFWDWRLTLLTFCHYQSSFYIFCVITTKLFSIKSCCTEHLSKHCLISILFSDQSNKYKCFIFFFFCDSFCINLYSKFFSQS